MIIEADGKILSRNARLTGDVVLGNLSAHADYPFALAISGLLGKMRARRNCAPPSRIRVRADPAAGAIEGTPWLLATPCQPAC
jgi:methyl-accepting chemotaxis protein